MLKKSDAFDEKLKFAVKLPLAIFFGEIEKTRFSCCSELESEKVLESVKIRPETSVDCPSIFAVYEPNGILNVCTEF